VEVVSIDPAHAQPSGTTLNPSPIRLDDLTDKSYLVRRHSNHHYYGVVFGRSFLFQKRNISG
jgi:hypothetical protein